MKPGTRFRFNRVRSTIQQGCLALAVVGFSTANSEDENSESVAARSLRDLGGQVFLNLKTGRVSEVNLNGNQKLADADLDQVARFSEMTDLSLEQTSIGDDGIARLAALEKLEWLNLFRTRITDESLKTLSRMKSLTHLPLGETRLSDRGLTHLAELPRLEYLGLRGNRITDKGIPSIARIGTLTGLHLGGTNITDMTLDSLSKLKKLEELWLFDTAITDAGLEKLARLKSLKRLHLQRTSTTAAGIRDLRATLPQTRIFWESESE